MKKLKCKIDGCGRDAMYKAQQVCQMHYFRMMRTGLYELVPYERKYRTENPAGYQKLVEPDHPLAGHGGHVYEHRMIIYSIYGDTLPPCEVCGKPESWETCHIDHIDDDVRNNSVENLRVSCNGCNTKRGRKAEHTYKRHHAVTFQGVTQTPSEWSRDPRVKVRGTTIMRRILLKGMSDEDALFAPKITHKNT